MYSQQYSYHANPTVYGGQSDGGANTGSRPSVASTMVAKSFSNDPTKFGSASDRVGRLHREEWYDYLNRFQPYDQRLLTLATTDADNEAAIQRSRESVNTAFDAASGSLQRDITRLGLSEADDERRQREASTDLARTAAEVGAINGTRLHTQDRDMKLMSGDMATGLRSGRLGGE